MERETFNTILKGYWESQVLFTAQYLGIFDYLAGKSLSGSKVAADMNLNPRGVEILLNALVGQGFLRKRKDRFSNSRFTERHLVRNAIQPLSGFVFHNMDMWDSWGDLPYIIKKGSQRKGYPLTGTFTGRKSLYNFALAMHHGGKGVAKEISTLFDFSTVNSILDIGGCTGRYALGIMDHSRADIADVVDLPEMVRSAKKVIREDSKEDLQKLRFIEGSYFDVNVVKRYDLVIISNILHSLDEKACLELVRKCRNWLSPNGRLLVHDFTINSSGTQPANSALFAVNMLVNTKGGNVYTEKQIRTFLRDSGYRKIVGKRTSGGNLVLLCRAD